MMYFYIFLLPVIALLSMYGFMSVNWTVDNYEGHPVPYSLGIFILIAYALMVDYFYIDYLALSHYALIYLVLIWFIGFIDDKFGQTTPKGIKGHLTYLIKKRRPTTGIFKIIGTLVGSLFILLLFEPESVYVALRYLGLLLLFPHMMNALDTRPLRVWKSSLFFFTILLFSGFVPSFLVVIYIVTIFYLILVMEGHRIAMLGDNGATLIGSILALWTITIVPELGQWLILAFLVMMSGIVERISLTALIARKPFLYWFDQLGVTTKKT